MYAFLKKSLGMGILNYFQPGHGYTPHQSPTVTDRHVKDTSL